MGLLPDPCAQGPAGDVHGEMVGIQQLNILLVLMAAGRADSPRCRTGWPLRWLKGGQLAGVGARR